ncbi:ABC transporter substrate-binding protein [Desulfoplanes sp. PS50]
MHAVWMIVRKGLLLATLVLMTTGVCFADQKVDRVVLSSPFSPLAMPMAYIVENNLLGEVAEEVDLVIWNTPDQLRAMMARGQANFVSVPSNVAGIFYNKGVPLKLVRVSIWGVFYIISNDPSISSLDDLRGKEIYIPFRGDQPDLMFQTICRARGLDPFKDFRVQYVSSPLDITMSLLAGKIDHAFMIEPAAAMAIMKAGQKGMRFARVIDIQKEWGLVTGGSPKFPNAGVVALPGALKRPDVVETFLGAYDRAVTWVNEHPAEAASMVARHVKGVNAAAFEDALHYTILESVSGRDSRKEIEDMFTRFMKLNPKSTGGRLPDAGFYF